MRLRLTVIGPDVETERSFAIQLTQCISGVLDAEAVAASDFPEHGPILFVAGFGDPGAALAALDRRGKAVFLIAAEDAGIPAELSSRQVDDVLVHPFRKLEVLSKIRHYHQILMWDEVQQINSTFSQVIDRLQEDLRFAERLQKAKLPIRFPEVKNFKVTSRYLAGGRSGGDYFDIGDSKDGNGLSLVLSDSSSYGLSSSVLAVLMKVAMKLSGAEARSCYETVRKIREEIVTTLREKDRLSLFYGVVSRKDFCLRYLNLGSSCAYYAEAGQGFKALPSQGEPIRLSSLEISGKEAELRLSPQSRLILLSDGFSEAVGGEAEVLRILGELRESEAADIANELVYRVKSTFQEPDDLPPQDCTVVVLDADAKVLRLANG